MQFLAISTVLLVFITSGEKIWFFASSQIFLTEKLTFGQFKAFFLNV